MKRRWMTVVLWLIAGTATAAPRMPALPMATRGQAETALRRGGNYLLQTQSSDGYWGKRPMAAIAALGALALYDCPGLDPTVSGKAVDRAMSFALKYARDNGSVAQTYRGLLFWRERPLYATYTTSVTLLAMALINKPEYQPLMQQARAYLQSIQNQNPESDSLGGFGYGQKSRPDLSNSAWAAEALYYTDYLDREPYAAAPEGTRRTQQMWAAVGDFLERCQKPVPATGTAEADAGGLAYRPGPGADLVATGSMSYAGLKTMIYARLDSQDPRVRGVIHYITHSYTLAADPGKGQAGYYYYLQMLAKGLHAYGEPKLKLADGRVVDWRSDLIAELAGRQREDGSWANPEGRYMESMPELVTAYSMMALKATLDRGFPTTR